MEKFEDFAFPGCSVKHGEASKEDQVQKNGNQFYGKKGDIRYIVKKGLVLDIQP